MLMLIISMDGMCLCLLTLPTQWTPTSSSSAMCLPLRLEEMDSALDTK